MENRSICSHIRPEREANKGQQTSCYRPRAAGRDCTVKHIKSI